MNTVAQREADVVSPLIWLLEEKRRELMLISATATTVIADNSGMDEESMRSIRAADVEAKAMRTKVLRPAE